MMKKCFYVVFAVLFANSFFAQTELARWNKTNLAPTVSASNITASNANSGYGLSSLTWDVSFFEVSSIPLSATIDTSKYLQFSVTPNSNYQVTVSSFNFTYRAQSSGQKFEVRYSTNSDFSNPITLTAVTTTDTNWHSLSQSNFTNPIIASGKTMYIRFYIFNGNYNSFHISNGTAGIAPNVIGTVANNTPPVVPVANNDSYSVYKNTSTDLSILSNDVSESSITGITITQQPAHGTITVNGTTNVTYVPTTGYSGTDTFKYKAVNATGSSNEATVSLNVITAVPVANNDSYDVYNNINSNLNILSNDTSALAITGITITQQPSHGTLTVNGTTNVTYKSVTGYTGADTFKYQVSNVTGPSNEATVSINVIQDPNTAVPVANNDSYTAYKNNNSDFNVLSNDTSVLAITGITITQQPTHGTLTVNGTTSVTYKPTSGYTGADSFKYKAGNTTGLSNEATVSINVIETPPSTLARWNNGNVNPTAYNNNITAGNIITNKVTMGYTTFSGPLYSFGGWPSQATVDNSYYVQFSISPKTGYKLNLSEFNFQCFLTGSGTMRIDYSLNSNFSNPKTLVSGVIPATSEASATTISLTNFNSPVATDGQVVYVRVYVYNTYQTLYIKYASGSNTVGPAFIGTVSSSSTTPIATDDTETTTVDNDTDINVLENDDYSNVVNSITLSQPSHGSVTLNSDNTVNYLPASGYIGSDSFTYSITNNYGTSNAATVSVNINTATTTSLIRWDSASATYYPTSYQSSISASLPVTGVGVTLSTSAESLPVYVIGNINDTAVNTSKYIQFRLNNTSTTKTIEPKNFSFTGRGYNPGNYEIRYSKSSDFSSYQTLSAGTYSNGYATISADFDSVKVEAGETLYIRAYFYNTTSSYVIQYYTGSTGPAITGLVYNKVYSSTDTIWQTASNPHWSNGTPTAAKNAIIETPYNTSVYGNFQSNNLTINTGGSLNINEGGYVTVNGQIVNNANNTSFVVANNASLLQNGTAQNTGNITVQKTALIPKMGYNYWSSPVVGQNLYQFSDGYNTVGATGSETGTPWNRFYVYNEANDYFVTSLTGDITLGATSVFQPGRSYAIRGKNSFPTSISATTPTSQFQFTGIPQNGDVSFTLKWTNAAHGYNMVGNPYPSNISFDDLVAFNNTKINNVIYLWTNNDSSVTTQQGSNYVSNNYALYNGLGGIAATNLGYNNKKPTGLLSVGQGFIVQATAAGKNQPLVFKNTMRYADAANFYNKNQTVQKDRFWLEFKSPTNVYNEILIGYIPTATNNYDINFDTELLSIGNDSFWSVLDTKKLGIQARAPFINDDVVPLGIKASVAGNYTISITDKEGLFNTTQDVLLKDNYLNKIVNLKDGSYVFNTSVGQFVDRFQIIYKNSGTLGTDNSVKKGIQIYKDVQNFIVKSPNKLDEVSVYDALGRLVYDSKNSKTEVLINNTNFPQGLYIIKARSGNIILTKKVLK